MIGSLERVRLAATRMGHAVMELAEWNAGPDPDHEEGERLFRIERYEEAETCFLKIVSDLKSRSRSRGRHARALLALAQVQQKLGKLKEALEKAESARHLFASRDKPSSELASCLELLGSLQEDDGSPDQARAFFRQALEIEDKTVPLDPLVLIQRCRRLAKALSNEEGSDALDLLNRTVDVAEKRFGTHAPITAECLMELGQYQMSKGDIEAGVAAMMRAVEIHRQLHGGSSGEVARDFECLGSACHKAGELEKAVHYYECALSVRERQVGGSGADLAMVMMALADAHSLLGNEGSSMELLQQAVGKLSGTGNEHLAWALENLGVSYSRSGRYDDAVACYRKANVLWKKQPEANRQILEANELHLQEALRYIPAETLPSLPRINWAAWASNEKESKQPVPGGIEQSGTATADSSRPRRRRKPAGQRSGNIEHVHSGSAVANDRQFGPRSESGLDPEEAFVTSNELPPLNVETPRAEVNAYNIVPISLNREAEPLQFVPSGFPTSRLVSTTPDASSASAAPSRISADASAVAAGQGISSYGPLPVTLVMDDNRTSVKSHPASGTTVYRPPENTDLCGWDELAFDLLATRL